MALADGRRRGRRAVRARRWLVQRPPRRHRGPGRLVRRPGRLAARPLPADRSRHGPRHGVRALGRARDGQPRQRPRPRIPTGSCARPTLPVAAASSRCSICAPGATPTSSVASTPAHEYPIGYLKWDHNRDLVDAGGAARGVHETTLALYRLLDELKAAHPGLEIESCASGGARVDLGILDRTDRIWTSDCLDPLERLNNQRYTGLLVPPELMGATSAAPLALHRPPARAVAPRARPLRPLRSRVGHLRDQRGRVTELAGWVALYKATAPCSTPGQRRRRPPRPGHRPPRHRRADHQRRVRVHPARADVRLPARPVPLPGLDPAASTVAAVRPVHRLRGNGQSAAGWAQTADHPLRAAGLRGLQAPVLFPEHSVLIALLDQAQGGAP